MIRNLKALGLAMVAAFALSAVGATAAQALKVNSPEGVTFTATKISQPEHPDHIFTLSSGRSFKCNNVLIEGTLVNGASTVEGTPTFTNCFSNGTQPTTVTHNGCNFLFYGAALNNVTVDLICPAGKEVEVHVYSSAANHTAGMPTLCTYGVTPFTGKHKNEITTTETVGIHDVHLTTIVAGVTVKRVAGTALSCGGESQTSTYTGATTVQAFSDTKHEVPVDLTIE